MFCTMMSFVKCTIMLEQCSLPGSSDVTPMVTSTSSPTCADVLSNSTRTLNAGWWPPTSICKASGKDRLVSPSGQPVRENGQDSSATNAKNDMACMVPSAAEPKPVRSIGSSHSPSCSPCSPCTDRAICDQPTEMSRMLPARKQVTDLKNVART